MVNPRFSSMDALMYDQGMSDWPGEIDIYQELAANVKKNGKAVLDIACGTGRVALPYLRI